MQKRIDRAQEVRCLNCFTRFRPQPKAREASCPECNFQWRISWTSSGVAKIRGPVWERLKPE